MKPIATITVFVTFMLTPLITHAEIENLKSVVDLANTAFQTSSPTDNAQLETARLEAAHQLKQLSRDNLTDTSSEIQHYTSLAQQNFMSTDKQTPAIDAAKKEMQYQLQQLQKDTAPE